MIISEYDAFGPWVYEIDDYHPAPALFRPYLDDRAYLKRVKIPRNIDRRKVTPDMELYDFVLEAGAKSIRILKREELQVIETTIPYSDLEGMRLSRIILNGSCVFCAHGTQIEIPFNAISMKAMEAFLRLIRSQYVAKEWRELPMPPMEEQPSDVLFVNLARDLQEIGERFSMMAFQPERQMSLLKRTLLPHRRSKAPAILHMTDGRELLLLERHPTPPKSKRTELGFSYTFLPLEKLRDVEIRESTVYADVTECHLKGEKGDIAFLAHREETAVLNFYQKLRSDLAGF